VLNKVRPVEAMELLIDRLNQTETNEEFVNSLAARRRDED
jgi:transcription termination factor Rho